MIRRLRDRFGGGTSGAAAEAAVGRGLADLLAALDNVIDDDAALGRIHAGLGASVPGAAPARGPGTASDQAGVAGSAITTVGAGRPARSRRRLALHAVAGVAAALTACVVALVAVVHGTGRGATQGPAVNTAYVVKRVSSALSAAEPGAMAQLTVTTHSGMTSGGTTATTTARQWSYGDQWRSVTDSPAGPPDYDEGSGAGSVYTLVSYLTRTWARERASGRPAAPLSGPDSCGPVVAGLPSLFQPGLPGMGGSASALLPGAGTLRAAVSCGSLTVAGRQIVDGNEAIELTSQPGSPISETIWVSPGTYLPVRMVVGSAPGRPGPSQTADITWLKPTAQNLAKLTVPIPAGFRQLPFAQAVTPLMQHTSAQSAP